MSDADCTILDCPNCQSHRAGIIASSPPQAKCSDCGKIYDITTLPPPPNTTRPKRIAEPGKRHRRDNGPSTLEVLAVKSPSPAEMGTATLHTEAIIHGGADELVCAHKEAARLSAKFGETFEAKWFLLTPWLRQLRLTHRARARYALTWRPRFLATVALTRSVMMGARAARVSPQTVMAHRRADPDFEAQVIAAEEHAVELLHDVTFRSALEGECEPVFWQGIPVGHVIKHDNRLRIEMLRAHMPDKFKTPGSKINVNSGNSLSLGIVIGEKERDELVALRREALMDMKPANAIEIESNAPNGA